MYVWNYLSLLIIIVQNLQQNKINFCNSVYSKKQTFSSIKLIVKIHKKTLCKSQRIDKMIQPVAIDIFNLRPERQRINNLDAAAFLRERDMGKKAAKKINMEEFKRVLEQLQSTADIVFDKCAEDPMYMTTLSGRISISASRQGTKDEDLQIQTCNITSSKFGINLENIPVHAFRPTKTGRIITGSEFKNGDIPKNDCLKSFDGRISGKKTGWIFAKLVLGSGGGQDSVFEEAHVFCEWVVKYGKSDELYIVLCDTDLIGKLEVLQKKFADHTNIIIGGHILVQQYIIDHFYE
jgi:hypothetical protein